jgi:hypothetical protein
MNELQTTQSPDPTVYQTGPVAVRQSATPADLVRYAMDTNADLDRLEKLMDMQTQWEEREARKAFVSDMALFKLNPPEIVKDNHVQYKTDKGVTSYWHASIGNVVEKIVAGLAEHGFSHRWIPERCEGGMVKITCVITHRLGHSESTTLEAGLDQSGGKNNIQAMISTKTYLERHTLLAATGLATKDQGDDYDERAAREAELAALRAAQASKEKAEWPQDKFDEAIKKHSGSILDGTKTSDDLEKWLEKKAPLTDAQRAAVKDLKPAVKA